MENALSMREIRNAYNILVRDLERRYHLEKNAYMILVGKA
jgi:uncharacterized protein YajQ (UPF0234 family)